MAKDQPKPALAPEQPKTLPDFDKFCLDMKPYLSRVRQTDVDLILQSLYRAAKIKVHFESERLWAQDEVPSLRSYRKKMAAAKTLISQALKLLANVDRDVRNDLVAERLGEGDEYVLYRFDEIVEFLEKAAQCAESSGLALVGQIHPDLRSKTEEQLAKNKIAGEVVAGTIMSPPYPARPKSSDIDHWFMGVAAKCLDQGQDVKGNKIPTQEKIIAKVFEVAFGDFMQTEGSVRRELTRQQERSKQLSPPDIEDIRWLSDLGQKSARNSLRRPEKSGQKRTKS